MQALRLALALSLCSVTSIAAAQTPNDPGEPGVITGKVIDSVGRAVPDARVYVRERNRPQMGAIRYVTTNQGGQFRIENLRPGDYDVYAGPSNSASMLNRSGQRMHLPKDKPIGKVTIRLDSSGNQKG